MTSNSCTYVAHPNIYIVIVYSLYHIFSSLVERLDLIKARLPNLTIDNQKVLSSIFQHLEEKRGWLADRFDALEDKDLAECSLNLTVVLITAKSDCIINLLGGSGSLVGQALAEVRENKPPVTLDSDTISDRV